MQQRLSVVHDGIDTRRLTPDARARFVLADGRQLSAQDEVVTYVGRGLEPYRGFHVFMRALPELMRRRPAAQFVVVGANKRSYGRPPTDAASWREKLLAELGDRFDPRRLHFTGKLPYDAFVNLLQVSRAARVPELPVRAVVVDARGDGGRRAARRIGHRTGYRSG
jgi:glycosyltransferase involved in cell wall biosynthesis